MNWCGIKEHANSFRQLWPVRVVGQKKILAYPFFISRELDVRLDEVVYFVHA